MKKFLQGLSMWLVVILVALFFSSMGEKKEQVKTIGYSEFKSCLRDGTLKECSISDETIEGVLERDGKRVRFKTTAVNDMKLIEELERKDVKYTGKKSRSWFTALLLNFGPILLFLVVWFFLVRSMQGGGKNVMAFAKSRAKPQDEKKKKTTFADVAGLDEVKEELQEIIMFLKDPKKFQRLGGKIPKGVLLYGAPGTGKTLLARAVAGEAGVPFFSASGSEFVEMFVGVGASRVRDLFNMGRKNAPSLLFIDELDAVGRRRFAGIGGGHDEREQTLNQMLVEMDGFDTREGVILIAATNRPDVLDPALLRPGRFDRHIVVPNPDLKGREDIMKVHAREIKVDPKVDLKIIARRTPGFVGSDLANLVNEAALLAARRNKETVQMEELEEAIDRVIAGPERKSRIISDREKRIIAFHEAGHAVVAQMLSGTDPVHKVSIIPRGPALGYTLQLPVEDRYLTTRSQIFDKMTVLLGGRTTEELFFDDITTGAESDLRQATELTYKMVCEWGMSDKIGSLTLREKQNEVFLGRDIMKEKAYSEKTAQVIDEEVKKIINECKSRAKDILSKNRKKTEKLAETLIEKEFLDSDEIEQIIGAKKGENRKDSGQEKDKAGGKDNT